MAFTIEEIERVFASRDPQTPLKMLAGRPAYTAIIDYLTGVTTYVPNPQQNFYFFLFTRVVYLIKDIEHPSANDQLVLDLINVPGNVYDFKLVFGQWLAAYAIDRPTDSALQVVLNQFNKLGHTDDEVFAQFVVYFKNASPATVHEKMDETPLLEHLRNYLLKSNLYKKSSKHLSPEWNYLYFLLLETSFPEEWVSAYTVETAGAASIPFLTQYKKGHYMPAILDYLGNSVIDHKSTITQKLAVAIALYQTDQKNYIPLLTVISKEYLHYVVKNHFYNPWENGYTLDELASSGQTVFKPSASAVHYLLLHDRAYITDQLLAWFNYKKFQFFDTITVLYYHLGTEALPFLQASLLDETPLGGIEQYRKLLNLLEEHFQPADYTAILWKLIGVKAKWLRSLVAQTLCEKDVEVEPKAIALLNSRTAEIRQIAANMLKQFPTPTAIEAVSAALQKEKSDDARDLLLEVVSAVLTEKADESFVEGMINGASERGKLDKTFALWLDETQLPALYYRSGRSLKPYAIRFLLYRMSRIKTMRSDIEARLLLNLIDREKAGAFAKEILKRFIENGAQADYKYLLALAALLGDEDVVIKIRATNNHWIEENRVKMAQYGVGALALQGSDKALRWVEWYSRKFRTKKAVIGATALQALEDAAEELGTTTHELGDRIVPDLGFDGLFKHFTIGSDEYRAFIDSNFKIAFFDEDNKKLKNIPAGAPAELKEAFKDIAKEVRDVVKSQSLRLEHYLVVQRSWPFEQWQSFFLNNPVMFIYATRLLWGIYVNGLLTDCFLCQEDTTLVNLADEEISLPENTHIRIVHPLFLSEALLQAWKRRFFDLSIEPIFPQLERPVLKPEPSILPNTIIYRYVDKETEPGSIRGTLERHGWRKGTAADAGSVNTFHYIDHESQLEAVLEVRGVFVTGFSSDIEPALGRLYFIRSIKNRNDWFNEPKDDKDTRLLPLHKIPAVFYSEVVTGVEAIKPKPVDQKEDQD